LVVLPLPALVGLCHAEQRKAPATAFKKDRSGREPNGRWQLEEPAPAEGIGPGLRFPLPLSHARPGPSRFAPFSIASPRPHHLAGWSGRSADRVAGAFSSSTPCGIVASSLRRSPVGLC